MTTGYDFCLVDLDGTLVDVDPDYIQHVCGRVGDRIGYDFTADEAERLWRGFGGGPDQVLQTLGIDPTEFWQAFHDIEDAKARAASTFLYSDAEVIGAYDRPVGLVTHCQPYLTEPVLDRLDIRDWFDVVVCCNDELGWKPDPGPVELATASMDRSLSGDTGVLIGDSPYDVGAAWNTGLDAIHVERHDPTRRGCCVRADVRVSRLDDTSLRTDRMRAPSQVSSVSQSGEQTQEHN